MSLALVQGYSSAEEEEEEEEEAQHGVRYHNSSDDNDNDDGDGVKSKPAASYWVFESSKTSSLPSASDVFSEISGPPAFLNNCVQEYSPQQQMRHPTRHNKHRKEKKDLPAGAIVESKANLVGIHERVRSDLDGKKPPTLADTSTNQGGKRVVTATNPSAEDAAALLRMCMQCGIPKTYSNARGMVCPTCGDRPVDATDDSKKKGSTIKDKEKNKRMKGQSSHATWKSETEMHLRQQFD